jgi:hypothetical protein
MNLFVGICCRVWRHLLPILTDEILRAIRETGVTLDEETLATACRVFEKQSEVDFFINKNARALKRATSPC